jgi:hypothetical protein
MSLPIGGYLRQPEDEQATSFLEWQLTSALPAATEKFGGKRGLGDS